jgi:hypothetical protein
MSAILKGFGYMFAGTLTFLALILVDRLAFLGLRPDSSTQAPSAQGMLLWPGVSNLTLVMLCALLVYGTGAMALRRDGHRLPEGVLPMVLALSSLLPVFLFALTVTLLRG